MQGLFNLEAACRKARSDLDLVVVFSSALSTMDTFGGSPANAAANAVLDAFVQKRRGEGLAGVSIQWGPHAVQRGDDPQPTTTPTGVGELDCDQMGAAMEA